MQPDKYDICIVGGLGRVGLPLGLLFADSGKKVMLHDLNQQAIDIIRQEKMPFLEAGAQEILSRVLGKTLFLSSEKQCISESHFIIVVIGTPVNEHLNPKFTLMKRFFSDILHHIKDDQHIILMSTVFPGTTEKIKNFLNANGKTPRISFCCERLAEGKAIEELKFLPQIVASFDNASSEEATKLFLTLTKDVVTLSPTEAELAKLFTNVWRYTLFSISNQFYQIATQNGLDFYRIYDAVTYKYPRIQGFAKAGFTAGPCLFKDTMQLAAYSNNSFFLGHAAMLINEGFPNFIVERLKNKYSVHDKVVGILGMAFKAENDDKRESLAYKLKKILEIEAKNVLCSDAYIRDESFVSTERLLKDSDIIVLATPHKQYKSLHFDQDKVLVDVWNFYGKGGLF